MNSKPMKESLTYLSALIRVVCPEDDGELIEASTVHVDLVALQSLMLTEAGATENVPVNQVVLPLDMVKRVAEHLSNYTDEGPVGQGWKSRQLKADVHFLESICE